MFRAGTTFLSYLLEQDPANRALLRWESGDSVPPPTPSTLHSDPRIETARIGNDMLEQINPRIRAIHHEEPDGPTECISVMSQDFKSLSWEAIANVPDVRRLAARRRSAFGVRVPPPRAAGAAERRGPRPLDAEEPAPRAQPRGAHRRVSRRAPRAAAPRPGECSARRCAASSARCRATFSDADHRAYIAEHWVTMLEESVRRIDAFRAAHPEHPIVDVQYADLVRDPVGAVESIYAASAARTATGSTSARGRR